jgi:uncharacterized protein YlzI (FlbEa/FlbD family)
MLLIDFQTTNGQLIYLNPLQIAGVKSNEKTGGTILYANGQEFDLKREIDHVKRKIDEGLILLKSL